ncbi:MAG: TnsD family transposase [Ignavibacteriaceae bacterium]|nr:TnsD family transposase [Ignavibacteriaceae bacterium]
MLGYFPTPYDDELLYSVIARYALHTGMAENQKRVIREVFSSSTAVAIPDLPSHLKALVKNLQLVWPVNTSELISTYTMATIYLPFLSPQQATKIVRSMCSNSGGNIHTRSGIAASAIKKPEYFRYCPKCMKEQLAEHGEYHWCRAHQLPGMDFCRCHECALESSSIYFHSKKKHLFVAAWNAHLKSSYRHREVTHIESSLNTRYEELVRAQQLKGLGVNRWTMFYRNLAAEHCLMRKSRVNHREIHKILKNAWSGTAYHTYFQNSGESYWLKNLFRKHRKSFHPLKHLLVTTALAPDISVKQILRKVRGLPDSPLEVGTMHTTILSTKSEICKRRAMWQELVKLHPEAGVKALRKLKHGGATYTWLYRNDRHWLMAHKPNRKSSNTGHFSIDYPAWDKSNVTYLELNYRLLHHEEDRPRLTRAKFIRTLPRSNSIEKHFYDLPETVKWLAAHEESIEEYQLYRLRKAYQTILTNNQVVKRWRLLRVANIRKELITPRIEAELRNLELKSR